ncbi:MAG: hypothetical protein KG003_14180 [Bacteroidetes bacterium]|nr:hypothetical protein [Bacteroidota bacterium]
MLLSLPTPRGTGIAISGEVVDLKNLLSTVQHIKSSVDRESHPHYIILNTFESEIENAQNGNRIISGKIKGFRYFWTDIILVIAILRYRAGYMETNATHQSSLRELEQCTLQAMHQLDPVTTSKLSSLVQQGMDVNDPYLLQVMENVNVLHLMNPAGKNRFKKVYGFFEEYFNRYSEVHAEFVAHLKKTAKQLKCEPTDLRAEDLELPEEGEW